MHRKRIFIFCFLLVVMALTTSQGQCENWKEFFKDGNRTWQYDKDSIHYPIQKNPSLVFQYRIKKSLTYGYGIRNQQDLEIQY